VEFVSTLLEILRVGKHFVVTLSDGEFQPFLRFYGGVYWDDETILVDNVSTLLEILLARRRLRLNISGACREVSTLLEILLRMKGDPCGCIMRFLFQPFLRFYTETT